MGETRDEKRQKSQTRVLPILKFLIVAWVCLVIPVAIIFALAPRSALAERSAMAIAGFARRVTRFPGFMAKGHPRCSAAMTWFLAGPPGPAENIPTISKRSHILRREGSIQLVETPEGEFWVPERDTQTLFEQLAEQSRNVYGRIRAGDVVLDCGANIGVFTRRALKQGASLVVSIDPSPEALECLRRNVSQYGNRVIVYPKGVWDKEENLALTVNDQLASTASSVVINRGKTLTLVPLTTIDKVVEELRISQVDFVKMDIEGAERQALRGAKGTIERFHPRMAIALEHRKSDADEIPELVSGLWPSSRIDCRCMVIDGAPHPETLFVSWGRN